MEILINENQYSLLFEQGIEPSDLAIKNICDQEKFCQKQGKITFGQLNAIIESALKQRLYKNVGEGGFKAVIRLLPWFVPQAIIAGVAGSTVRAMNKILRPALSDTQTYKTWWGKAIMKSFDIAEGELNIRDPFYKIFFISDGLFTMIDDKFKVKFARYMSELVDKKPDDEEVPEYFVENELRNWINEKFLLDPKLPPKT
jgi:hypothetical protein